MFLEINYVWTNKPESKKLLRYLGTLANGEFAFQCVTGQRHWVTNRPGCCDWHLGSPTASSPFPSHHWHLPWLHTILCHPSVIPQAGLAGLPPALGCIGPSDSFWINKSLIQSLWCAPVPWSSPQFPWRGSARLSSCFGAGHRSRAMALWFLCSPFPPFLQGAAPLPLGAAGTDTTLQSWWSTRVMPFWAT